jgi:maleylacetate reductase
VWGLTEFARKTTGVQDSVLPVSVIYDSQLTVSLPVELTVASGLNAMAHCIDSMWAPRTDPINQALAAEGIRALAEGLPIVTAAPTGIDGRDQCLYGAYLSAVAFASAGSGMHHKICHVLGGTYNLPHAQTHAVVLPRVLEYNAPDAPRATHRIAGALGAENAVAGLRDLYTRIGAPTALRDVGFEEKDIPQAASIALEAIPASNPRVVDQRSLEQLLHAAWSGAREIPLSSVR